MLNGSLLEELRQVTLCGDRLADSRMWDGREAADFRQRTWPQVRAQLQRGLDTLRHLQASSEKIVADIMAAGNTGAVASTVAGSGLTIPERDGGGQGRSLWQKLGHYAADIPHYAAYIPLEAASFATYGKYYVAYRTLKYWNNLPAPLRVPLTAAAFPIKAGLVGMEAEGLAGDVTIDLIKNAVLHNGESWKDEGYGPFFGNGLKSLGIDPFETHLPGIHPNGAIDWEW
jgi:hypothetical protein